MGQRRSSSIAMGRRRVLLGLPAALVAPRVLAQSAAPLVPVRHFNNVMIAVSDLPRSISFYQKLFGPPVLAADGAIFRVGDGAQFFMLSQTRTDARPAIVSYGLAVDDFDAEKLAPMLTAHGVAVSPVTSPAIRSRAACWVRLDPGERRAR